MNEAWARPDGDGPPPGIGGDGSIEIELAGPDATGDPSNPAAPSPGGVEPDGPNWRKVIGVASLLGAAIGIVIAVVLLSGGDDTEADDTEADDTTETTLDPELAASRITTPPTLPPVVDPPPFETGPTAPTSQTLDLFRDPEEQVIETSGLELPGFEPAEWSPAAGEFELTPESMAIDNSIVTELTLQRIDDVPDTAVIRYDATNGLVVIVSESDPTFGFIVDPAGGHLYNNQDGERWERAPVEEFGEAAGIDLDEYVGAVLQGPLRPSTFAAATITADGFVADDSGEIVRVFEVVIPVEALPEWTLFYDVLTLPSDSSRNAMFRALVGADGALHRIDGLNVTAAGDAVLSSHVLSSDAEVTIELPPASAITEVSLLGSGEATIVEPAEGPGPVYDTVAISELTWADVDAALAAFVPPDDVTVTDWYPDGTLINSWRRSSDGRTWAFRQLTRAGPVANFEQITDTATDTTYYRDAADPNWRVVDVPPLDAVDDARFDLMIDPAYLRSLGPVEQVDRVADGDAVSNRVTLVVAPGEFDVGSLSPIAEVGVIAEWPTRIDVLVSDAGLVTSLIITPIDADRSLAIEQRLDHDADPTIDLPTVDS